MKTEFNELMKITGKIHCLFEQSGTFKGEFAKLGYDAFDYDIQNNFGKTDFVIDLFAEIEKGYNGEVSVFDNFSPDDLLFAFFPCIYFCAENGLYFQGNSKNYRAIDKPQIINDIIKRAREREKFYELLLKLCGIVEQRGLRLIIENPYSVQSFLYRNFPYEPSVIDKDRTRRGDCFTKPTQYFFINCAPTWGETFCGTVERKRVRNMEMGIKQGICSEERSMITPTYAHNFICDFIFGKVQRNTQLTIFQDEIA